LRCGKKLVGSPLSFPKILLFFYNALKTTPFFNKIVAISAFFIALCALTAFFLQKRIVDKKNVVSLLPI
jgi:hypothetical protein